MRSFCAAISIAFIAAPSLAGDYSGHHGVTLFTQEPCTAVIEILDGDEPDLLMVGVEGLGSYLAAHGMAWGFILGYDTARGGLHDGEKTTLMRLREECATTPDRTAFDILETF